MAANQIQVVNTPAASAYTEYNVTIPGHALEVTLQLRPNATPANVFWYTAPSGSVSPGTSANLPASYGTIPAGSSRAFLGKFGGQVIYFQVDQGGQVLELDYHADV